MKRFILINLLNRNEGLQHLEKLAKIVGDRFECIRYGAIKQVREMDQVLQLENVHCLYIIAHSTVNNGIQLSQGNYISSELFIQLFSSKEQCKPEHIILNTCLGEQQEFKEKFARRKIKNVYLHSDKITIEEAMLFAEKKIRSLIKKAQDIKNSCIITK